MFGFYIGFSRQRTPSGKRFVSANLAASRGNTVVTSTESQRFRQSRLAKAVICRVAAVLTTQVSTCRHRPEAQSNSVSNKLFSACRGVVIGTMRATLQCSTISGNVCNPFPRNRFKCAQRRCPTHTVSIAMSRGESTSPAFSHLPVRLNLRVVDRFGLSFHVLCHGLDDATWWHSATKQVPAASAPSATEDSSSPIRP